MADEDQDRMIDAQALFDARTTAKFRHTNTIKRDRTLLSNAAPRADLDAFMPTLNDTYNELVDIHQRFVDAANLDPERQDAAQAYLQKNTATAEHLRRSNKSRPSNENWSSGMERIQQRPGT